VVLYPVAVHRWHPDAAKSHISCTFGERIKYAVPGRRYVYNDIESLLSEETMSEGDILGKIVEIVASGGKANGCRTCVFSASVDGLTIVLLTIIQTN
jgi:hypothetical protein